VSAPAFSVVIPAFNAQLTIAATIESVLTQTLDDFELIVIDDGSSDATARIARSYEKDRRVRVCKQPNQGTAAARNSGVNVAAGRRVSFLDNDDLWMPTYLETMAATLDATTNAGFAYADGWLLDDVSGRIHRRTALQRVGAPFPAPADPREFLLRLVERTFIRSATTIPRAVLEEVGGFDTTLSGVDDFDLWVRILAAEHRAAQAPGMLLIFRDRPDSLSKQSLRMVEGRREVLRRIASTYQVPTEIKLAAVTQLPALDRLAAAISGRSAVGALLLHARLRLGTLRRALMSRRRFHRKPPAELTAVFGDPARL
jgi:glycosyltransferase involved in cell wall biosynthesis